MSKREPVGRVVRVRRYPLKSAAAEDIEHASIGWHGVQGDRRYAFLRTDNKSGFPWITAREIPELVTWKAWHAEPDAPQRSDVLVQLPGTSPTSVRDPALVELVADRAGERVQLLHLWSGIYDADALSIIGTASMTAVCASAAVAFDAARFRANVEIETLSPEPFAEDRLVGERLVFGERGDSARVLAGRRDRRCSVVDIDPANGCVARGLLDEIAKARKNNLGVYARTEGPGTIAVGDIVFRLR